MQTLWANAISDEFIKFIVNAGTKILKLVDNLDTIPLLVGALGAFVNKKYFNGNIFKYYQKDIAATTVSIEEARKQLQQYEDKVSDARGGKSKARARKKYDAYKEEVQPQIAAYDAANQELEGLKNRRAEIQTELDGLNTDLQNINSGKTKFKGKNASKQRQAAINKINSNITQKTEELNKLDEQIKTTEANIANMGQVTVNAANQGTTGLQRFWKSFRTGAKSALKAVGELGQQLLWMFAISAIIQAIEFGVKKISEAHQGDAKTAKETKEEFENLQSELEACESELESLESELDSTQEQIDELLDSGTLTFTEQEELDRLRSVSSELERQIKLTQTLQKTLDQQTSASAITATDAYLEQTSFGSKETKTERQEEKKAEGRAIGTGIGLGVGILTAVLAALLTPATGGGSVAAWLAANGEALALGGSVAGYFVGGGIGSAAAGSAYDSEQSVGEAIDRMQIERAKLQADKDAAKKAWADTGYESTGKAKEAYDEAAEALSNYDEMMSKHIAQIQQYVNAVDYSTLKDKEQQDKYREYLDALAKYNITMGTQGAKESAIENILGDSSTISTYRKTSLEDAFKGIKIEDVANIDISKILTEKDYNDLVARLNGLGLTITDLQYYFFGLNRAEEEALEDPNVYDTVKSFASATEAVNSLTSAFEEFTEAGSVSAATLVSLNDTFGDFGDTWIDYVNIMASGTASTQEAVKATQDLVEALTMKQIADGPITDTLDYVTKLAQLQRMGVQNAKEYLDAMQQVSVVDKIANDWVNSKADVIEGVDANGNKTAGVFKNVTSSGRILTAEELEKEAKKVLETGRDELGIQIPTELDTEDLTGDNALTRVQDWFDNNPAKVTVYSEFETDDAAMNNLIEKYEKEYGIKLDDGTKADLIDKAVAAKQARKKADDAQTDKNKYEEAVRATDTIKAKIANINNATTTSDLGNEVEYKASNGNNSVDKWIYNGTTYYSLNDVKAAMIADLEAQIPVTTNPKVDVDALDDAADEAEDVLQDALDEIGLTAKIKLIDASEAVDQIQNAYDTLYGAAKEYAENGYLNVDTLQSILTLEPKYIALLQDENGNLRFNKQALLEVAQARVTDMGIQAQKNILEEATRLATEGSISAMQEYVDATYDAAEANEVFIETEIKKIQAILNARVADKEDVLYGNSKFVSSYIQGVQNQLNAVDMMVSNVTANISKSISTIDDSEGSDAFDKAMEYWENRISASEARYQQIQNEIDLLEKQGKRAGEEYYQEQLKLNQQKKELLEAQQAEAEAYLNTFEDGSEDWWKAASKINEIENSLDECTATVLELSDAIANIHWGNLTEFNDRINTLHDSLSDLREMWDEDDWFDESGDWTEDGLATVATYIQDLEIYKNELSSINEELAKLNQPYAGNEDYYAELGLHSEQELYDKREELINQQHDYQKGIKDSEDAVVDMYEAQIDKLEEYHNELTETYSDYIEFVKEAIEAERDLYEWKKNIQKQTKSISETERKIAALGNSTNQADIAERRKLQKD